jgi:hypothetical protein
MEMVTRERGQVLPIVAALMVVCGLAPIALGRLGGRAVTRAQAQAAADAAALAGAIDGRGGAERLAVANRGRLVAFAVVGDDRVRVDVDVGGVIARAQAQNRGRQAGSGDGVAPAMAAALQRAAQVVGLSVRPIRVIPPGLVVDVDTEMTTRLAGRSDETGLCQIEVIHAPGRFGICPVPPSALAISDGT